MPLLDSIMEQKKSLLETIARLTNPKNPELRKVVEETDYDDVDLTALEELATNLRASKSLRDQVTGDGESNKDS